MAFGKQLSLLLWKNFTLRKRHPIRIVIELVWPLFLFLILVAVKKTRPDLDKKMTECHYDGKAMPSAGPLPFFQGLICTFTNKCHQTMTADERPGVDTWNSSLISEFFYDIELFLSNQNDVGALVDLLDDLNYLDELRKNPPENCTFSLGSVLIDPAKLRSSILSQNISLSPAAIAELLNSSLSFNQLVNISQYLMWARELQANMSQPQNLADAMHQIRAMVCTDDRTREILWLGSWNLTRELTTQLCNLTNEEFQEVVQDVVQDLDWTKLYTQLVECSGRELKYLNNDQINAGEFQNILKAFSDMESLQGIIRQFNATMTEARADYQSDKNGSVINSTALLSQLFCGRDSTFSGEEQSSMEKAMEEQKDADEEDEEEEEEVAYLYQNDTTEFCNALFKNLQKTQFTRLLWRQVKPMIRGKLLYTPDNPAVRMIIKEANKTFETLAKLKSVAQDWIQLSPNITEYMETSPRINIIRKYLDELSNVTSIEELNNYMRRQLPSQLNLPPFIGSPFIPPIGNLLPANWTPPFSLPGGLEWNTLVDQGLKGLNQSTFEQVERLIRQSRQWFMLEEQPDIYTWRNTINATNSVMETLKNFLDCFEFNKFEGHATEDDLIKSSLTYIEQDMLWSGLVFDFTDNMTVPSFVPYRIRMDRDRVDTTTHYRVLDRFYHPGPRASPLPDMKYIVYGFAYIQDMVTHGIIRLQTNITVDEEIGIRIQQFPYPCYLYAKFVIFISRSIPLFMVLAWIYSVAMIVKGIVYEKEQRLKEVMKIMGLSNGVHWLAWFITCFVMMFASIILLILTVKGGDVISKSSSSVLLVFYTVFAVATITQCFMFSVFFSRANMAAACAAIFYFIGYLPYSFCVNWEDVMTVWQKFLACLASTTAFGYGCSYIAKYEEMGEGLQWHNIAQSPVIGDDFNMAKVLIIMLVDSFIYWIIAWYVEAVKPGEFGMPRPWNFCFTRSYWCGSLPKDDLAYASGVEMDTEQHESFESEPKHLPLGVAIRGLRKIYKRGQKVAVDGLTLNFFEGQITSFLGHNGAGKTTTMSILTGLFPPTEGTAYVYNQDIRHDIESIRKNLGMCPQHNVLFDDLTVEEHIWFYSSLKGVNKQAIKDDMKQMISDVGLVNKSRDAAKNLSGGMKRKLSIAIAFVGGSKVVILDEPTAGVDPYARRSIWDLLLKYRKDRTIILSTHFMDEADILGDRIAIISQGKLCCCGTSMFLKAQFGSGYYLTLVKEGEEAAKERMDAGDVDARPGTASSLRHVTDLQIDDKLAVGGDEGVADLSDQGSDNTNSGTDSTNVEKHVTAFIKKLVPDATLVEDVGTELTYQLSDDKSHTATFGDLFNALDDNLIQLGISSYGISDTTLEEVFLKVAQQTGMDCELEEESTRQQMNLLTDGGNLARPVTRISFRKNKKFGIFGMKKTKTTDERGLMDKDAISDAGSVFEDDDDNDLESADSGIGIPIDVTRQCNGAGAYTLSGFQLGLRQFWAQIVKRFHHMRRSKKAFIVQILLPAIFICLAMVFAMVNPPSPNQPPLELHPWRLIPEDYEGLELYSFYSHDARGKYWANMMEATMKIRPGLGNRCMDPDIHTIDGYPCAESDLADQSWTRVDPYVNTTVDCDCDRTGYQSCPEGAAGPDPSVRLLPTTEYMYNMSQRNITDWILKSHDRYIKQRYGGMAFGEQDKLVLANTTQIEEIVRRLLVASNGGEDPGIDVALKTPQIVSDLTDVIESLSTRRNAKIWFNNKGWISMVSYMNVVNNLILRTNLPVYKHKDKFGIAVSNHPMNRTQNQLSVYTFDANIRDVLIAISVIFAMSNVPASFIMFLCEERASNSKHLQFVSGINPAVYWLANFTWDMLNYIVSAVLCILIMVAFQVNSYVSAANAPCLIALMLLYGWAVIPMMYPSSFLFRVPSTAFVVMSCVNIFLGIISTLSTFILESFMEEDLNRINEILMKVFLLLPHYCLGRGLIDMTRNQIIADIFAVLGEDRFRNPFSWDIVGRNLLAMTCLGPLFFLLTLAIEYKFWYYKLPCIRARHVTRIGDDMINEDVDVARERRRIEGTAPDDILVIQGLTKVYRKARKKSSCRAVDNISMGVHKGECFGLLGVNGAGKTTTFKMLTGDTNVTAGNASLAGHSILTDMTSVHQNLGYCPQFDALCPLLTGKEHLELYARLRGVPEADVKVVAAWAIRKLGLTRYATKCAGEYSGGNKRKLSTAISLVGNPPVIFLDEPTTGMDPKARRFLWNCITNIMKDGRSVILTSHSMEECEALCSRIAIMVNGVFKCIGGTQHLKNRFGDGYTLKLRVSGQNPDMNPVMMYIQNTFTRCQLLERHHNMVQYQLGADHFSLAYIFSKLEKERDHLHIEDYSVSQTTLDQVFINFAKLQTDMNDDDSNYENMATPYPSDSPPRTIPGGIDLPNYGHFEGDNTPSEVVHDSTSYQHVSTAPAKHSNSPIYSTKRPTASQFHGTSIYQESEDESLRGSTVDLLPTGCSDAGKSHAGIADVSNC